MRMSNSSVSSPFWDSGSWFFFFPVRAFRFSRKNFAPGCSRNDDSCLPRPTASPVLLAWSGAQPCGARRAERLGRSGGPGQQRARCGGGPLGASLLHLAPDRLMPRMVCRRRPLPFLDCNRHARALLGLPGPAPHLSERDSATRSFPECGSRAAPSTARACLFEFEGIQEDATAQFGQAIADRVNFGRCHVKPNLSLDAAVGADLWKTDRFTARLLVQSTSTTVSISLTSPASSPAPPSRKEPS